ncbi:MAG: hypothetical protein H8E81_09075 [Deltaproteobacteria bacterium]|nr:hypothetical protein [Deltaproteobacteria bacterium]
MNKHFPKQESPGTPEYGDMPQKAIPPARRCFLLFGLGAIFFAISFIIAMPLWAQKEVTTNIYRYQEREKQSRIYEKYEYKRRSHQPFMEAGIPRTELITLAPTAEKVRFRKYLADSHRGLRFYKYRTCIRCHPKQARNLHRVRANIACRQCHGEEPIAGNSHYNSSMHPRRRYAVVCGKCHKGSNASFATYVVHEPTPLALSTQKSFPVLFYAVWFMVVLAAGTFASLLPQMLMWGLREFLPATFRWRFKDLIAWRRKTDDQD